MNIFVLDNDIRKAAEYHNDKHVVKMILECAQLLCTTHHCCGPVMNIPYKKTHMNHPCAVWSRESMENYLWLVSLGLALCEEYTYRYHKTHKTQAVLQWAKDNIPNIPDKGLTPFAQCIPDDCKNVDAVVAYRNYYNTHKATFNVRGVETPATWKNRDKPYWFTGRK